jgi:hypothetical protein
MYATSAPDSHVGTTRPVVTWIFEAEIGEGRKAMTLVATPSIHGWTIRKITSTPDDPARDL